MKKSLNAGLFMLLMSTALLFNGCSKDGADGAPGAQGPQGAPGANGVANIISHTYTVSTWNNNSSIWYQDLNFPEITPSNINTASVQVYFGNVADNWEAVPFTVVNSSGNYFMSDITYIGGVEIQWEYNGVGLGSNPNSLYSATSQFKVVVIPPALIQQHPDVNLKDYSAVKRAFNLK